MARVALVMSVVVIVLLAVIAGEEHRGNCIERGRVACSILPWDDGVAPGSPVTGMSRSERDALIREALQNRP